MLDKIQKLREITGAGVMECKRAIDEAGGDIDKAISIVRERGLDRAEKKKDRVTGEGLLHAYIHNNRVGVLLDIRCETDFVARSEEFHVLASSVAMQIAAMNPLDKESLLLEPYIRDESMTIEELIKQSISKLGENIQVERFCRYEI